MFFKLALKHHHIYSGIISYIMTTMFVHTLNSMPIGVGYTCFEVDQ